MKVKNLQINVLALLFGFAVVCFVNKIEANNATKSPEGQQFFDQNGDNVSNQSKKNNKRGTATTLSWNFSGPINVSGKINAVVSDPSDRAIVYVGTAHGGVWKSADGGSSGWKKVPVDNNKNLYVTCLALDETSNVLYAGTGGDFTGQGIYKAEGSGALKLMPGTEGWTNVSKIAIFGNKVYAATSAGLMCYVDGTWKVCTGTESGNFVTLDGVVHDVSVNKTGLVIVSINKNDCYVSKTGSFDGFEYKENLRAIFTSAPPYELPDNISVTTSPVNNNVLYAVAVHPENGQVYKVLLSENKGDTWEPILSWFMGDGFIDPLEGNGKNINKIYADPIDPYTIYIASINIWKGTRYGTTFDFGLSAISTSGFPSSTYEELLPEIHPRYLHTNVRAIDFYAAHENIVRNAYVATDGGICRVAMEIIPHSYTTWVYTVNKDLPIGSCNHVSANNQGEILMGTPMLGVQAIDTKTNNPLSVRYVWDLSAGGKREISEGKGGACAISAINEEFYIYSLMLNNALVFRRSVDRGKSFQPARIIAHNTQGVEWFSKEMLPSTTQAPKYDAPMAMWESFNDTHTFDTVWFKADTATNFFEGDRTIYASSKNFKYPIEYTVPYGFTHGDSIQVPDPVQNRFFVGLQHKIFMTREALDYAKKKGEQPPPAGAGEIMWFQIATLDSKDTTAIFALSDDANTLYAATKTGNIWCLTNLKEVYNTATDVKRHLAGVFTDKKIRAMAVDPTDDNHVVVVLEGGGDNLYETFNGKSDPADFTPINKENLPNNIYAVLLPKGTQNGTIMLGTEKGIWMKENGSEWTANNSGLGEVPVMTLTQLTTYRPGVKNVPSLNADSDKIRINYPSNNKSYLAIYAGTYGSGVFSCNTYVGIDEIPDKPIKDSNTLTVVPNPVTDNATIEIDMTKGQAIIQIFSVDGRLITEQTAKNTLNTINFKDYAPGTYIIQVMQGDIVKSGKVIKQ